MDLLTVEMKFVQYFFWLFCPQFTEKLAEKNHTEKGFSSSVSFDIKTIHSYRLNVKLDSNTFLGWKKLQLFDLRFWLW